MKYFNKTLVSLLALCAFSFSFASCDDDDDPVAAPEAPAFELATERMSVKIGTDNKQSIDITSGAGEYSAYVLDETIARIVEEDGQVYVEGLRNGQTTVIVTDAADRYRRIAIQVYTTEVMTLSDTDIDIEAPLGYTANATASVVLGNGEYTIESDNDAVTASIDGETGEISITGRGRLNVYTAVLTVTDCTGISATINVNVTGSTTPFTADDLNTIKARTDVCFNFNGTDDYYIRWGTKVCGEVNGKMRVGYTYYSYYAGYVEFDGELTEGTKTGGHAMSKSWNSTTESDCDVEVIQNDGTKVWVIFSWVDYDNEKLNRGYAIGQL